MIDTLTQSQRSDAKLEIEAITKQVQDCLLRCRIADIFADSKFLREDSLLELVKAIIWVAGGPSVAKIAASGKEMENVEVSTGPPCAALLILNYMLSKLDR